jgi:UDP-glucose:(heptosyl)LPS alpha-1,3-glucosyltransferase
MMAHASLFILPTLEDLFSLTVLEAMACGCPVITTPFNGARELVTEGENGWLADPTQPGDLMRALKCALSQQTDLTAMGKKARERVLDMDNCIIMARFADTLRSLAR